MDGKRLKVGLSDLSFLGEAGRVARHLPGRDVTLASAECSLWPGFPSRPPLSRAFHFYTSKPPHGSLTLRSSSRACWTPPLFKPSRHIEPTCGPHLPPLRSGRPCHRRHSSPVFSLATSVHEQIWPLLTVACLAPTRSEPASFSPDQCRSLSGFPAPPALCVSP